MSLITWYTVDFPEGFNSFERKVFIWQFAVDSCRLDLTLSTFSTFLSSTLSTTVYILLKNSINKQRKFYSLPKRYNKIRRSERKPLVKKGLVSKVEAYCIVQAVRRTFAACWCCYPLPTLSTYLIASHLFVFNQFRVEHVPVCSSYGQLLR